MSEKHGDNSGGIHAELEEFKADHAELYAEATTIMAEVFPEARVTASAFKVVAEIEQGQEIPECEIIFGISGPQLARSNKLRVRILPHAKDLGGRVTVEELDWLREKSKTFLGENQPSPPRDNKFYRALLQSGWSLGFPPTANDAAQLSEIKYFGRIETIDELREALGELRSALLTKPE